MRQRFLALAAIAAGALSGIVGCHRSLPASQSAVGLAKASGVAAAVPAAPAPLTAAQLAQARPNEAGLVPILEYHDVGPKEGRWERSIPHFRADLERLYKEGYRPIALEDYLANRIALPLGASPVILTFDDARASQFRYQPDGTIDPDCAVGILQAFHQAHPDFALRATFYVLPQSAFEQPSFGAKKMQALLAMGFEIGNHTVTHHALKRLSDAEVQKELAMGAALTLKLAPQARIDTVALPYGSMPRHPALLASGEYQGQRYANHAALLVGAGPAPSPVARRFKPMLLPRIQAVEGPMGITYWLNDLKRHPGRRYVSDGNPKTITIPRILADKVDKARLQGAALRLY